MPTDLRPGQIPAEDSAITCDHETAGTTGIVEAATIRVDHEPPLGSKPSSAKLKGAAPGQATFKPFSKIHKEMHKIKGGQPMLHSPPPSKPAAAVKSKVVWKQTVTW